jgi:hypothetical protein
MISLDHVTSISLHVPRAIRPKTIVVVAQLSGIIRKVVTPPGSVKITGAKRIENVYATTPSFYLLLIEALRGVRELLTTLTSE